MPIVRRCALLMAGPATRHPDAARRTLRAIAVFEFVKGVLAVAAALGVLRLLHHDLHALALALIGRVGLAPGAHYPALLLQQADRLQHADVRQLLLAVALYATVRIAEGYGLWMQRRWGAWLGALSGAVYVAYFRPSWTPFQADRGQHFSVIVDGVSV